MTGSNVRRWRMNEVVLKVRDRWDGQTALLGQGLWPVGDCIRMGLLRVKGGTRPRLPWDGYIAAADSRELEAALPMERIRLLLPPSAK